jgi:DNA-binding beta-propeller fold protein YncE
MMGTRLAWSSLSVAYLALAAGWLLAGCGSDAASSGFISAALPTAKARRDATYLYVANQGNASVGGQSIEIFDLAHPLKGPLGSIRRHISEPDGIFIDVSGTLYVANADQSGDDKVTVYPRGARKPSHIYAGAVCAFDAVAGTDGTVYVADACGIHDVGRVMVFEHGSNAPTRYVYPGGSPYSLTLDSHNNLYVGYNSYYTFSGQVKRYAPGAQHGEKLLPDQTVHFLSGVGLDNKGALLVANQHDGVIDVFTSKGKPPTRIIKTGQGGPFSFAFDRRENRIYVSYPCRSGGGLTVLTASGCGKRHNTVVALDYASGKRLWTLREQFLLPFGVAVSPSAPF